VHLIGEHTDNNQGWFLPIFFVNDITDFFVAEGSLTRHNLRPSMQNLQTSNAPASE
jgi:hypothetical protein